MDHRPRTGVTGAVSASDLDLIKGGGAQARAVVRGSRTLVDGFMVWVISSGNSPFKVCRIVSF